MEGGGGGEEVIERYQGQQVTDRWIDGVKAAKAAS